jgi:dienelactone hydrolase
MQQSDRSVQRARTVTALTVVLVLACASLAAASAGGHRPSAKKAKPTGCIAPAGNPKPGSDAWQARDQQNMVCSTARLRDEVSNPAFSRLSALEAAGSNPNQIFGEVSDPRLRSWGSVFPAGGDPFRIPTRWVAMGRGQYEQLKFISKTGAKLDAELFSPNPHPGKRYPIVTFTPGLQEAKEQAWWYGEGLAEAGYVVLVIDPQGQGASESTSRAPNGEPTCLPQCKNFPTDDKPETRSAAVFALSTPHHRYRFGKGKNGKGTSHFNPLWREVNRHELGIAGHSLGAIAASPIGQAKKRVKAVISYDNLDGTIPPRLTKRIHAPALYFATDYQFPTFATPMSSQSPPKPGRHLGTFRQLRKAHVDVMEITPRASTHYEWDQQSALGSLPASRFGQVMSLYYTQAWFDRYLKHKHAAVHRLTARRFNRSADRHSIGAGTYDAKQAAADPTDPTAGNRPYKIHGKCAADLLSFYYASAYWLDHGRVHSRNMRHRGCRAHRR